MPMAFVNTNNDIDITDNTELTWMALLAITGVVSLFMICEKYLRHPTIRPLTKENLEIHLRQISSTKVKKSDSGQSDTTQKTFKSYSTNSNNPCENSRLLYERKRF